MLTFGKSGKNNRSIAIITGGEFNDHVVNLDADLKQSNRYLFDDYKNFESMYGNDVDEPIDEVHYQILKQANNERKLTTKKMKEIEHKVMKQQNQIIGDGRKFILNPLDNSKFHLLPNLKSRDTLFLVGMAKSGKSTLADDFCYYTKKVFPERDIYWLSTVNADDSVDEKGITRIKIEPKLLDIPMNIKDLNGSLVVMDDIDRIPELFIDYGEEGDKVGERLMKKMLKVQNDILMIGRAHSKDDKGGVSLIAIRHCLYERSKTNPLHNSCIYICVFPNGVNPDHLMRYFKQHGFDKDLQNKLRSERYFIHCREVPKFVMGEKFIYLL
jgi:hypothetical protein